jgi:large repetitive protein
VTIAVAAVNDVPVANLDQFTFNEDGGLAELDVLANDTGLGDGPVTVVSFTPASHGTLTRDGNKMQYTPRANFNGTDIFTYTVRDADGQQASASVVLAVRPVNDPPVARDDAFAVIAGLSTSLGLLDNDFDPDGNGLTLVSVSAPLFGQVSIVNNRALFAAPLELFGLSTFTYTISDGQGGTATATVSLDVRLQ